MFIISRARIQYTIGVVPCQLRSQIGVWENCVGDCPSLVPGCEIVRLAAYGLTYSNSCSP
jgi:hypothetical protein